MAHPRTCAQKEREEKLNITMCRRETAYVHVY
jgi:hypothetical protein